MFAIVDGGSTKCDWIILDNSGKTLFKTVTIGFNPNIIDAHLIPAEIKKNNQLYEEAENIDYLFFYGSGCGVAKNCLLVEHELKKIFTKAEISVKEDLTAAAYAAYVGKPAVICILGTGSNSCFFDGKTIRRDLPSLGFLIGDEGSGNALGKILLKNYFMKKFPEDLNREFEEAYNLNIENVISSMYHNPRANAYLADFSKFILERKQHPYLQHLVFEEIKNFLDYQVLPYEESKNCDINFIGSIAHYYEDILRAAAAEMHLKVGKVVQKPIESLAEYHIKYILPKLKDQSSNS
ncbi:BadF/BadG/BcrA/BcrD ATPase family protein [Halpernia frigidisoli]|uniref:BadF-type ATPase n=1 Tax=Halpernia frigidisoli TaxID=1125876 RepID=A0A1I3GIA5_9FLAO|nr:BadF/BadG/BcrA/BcrD ATPase family protein [Halpernia frigidisoli]SFI22891.1 BadF-type ATPase [Halpernia frigidisoli]